MNTDNPLDAFLRSWKRIPEQLKRLPVLFVIAVAALLVVRSYLVPDDFGTYGHYRASAVAEIADLPIHYAGHQICADCHDEEVALKQSGYHKGLACEICHGPAAVHTDDPDLGSLRIPDHRGYCPLCHEYLPSRPTGFPQIVTASHNPRKACVSCHDPHDPTPPSTPAECEACHATIARTKAVSDHVYLPCTRCHEAAEEHKIEPRRYPPSRPQTREFCGGCHALDSGVDEVAKRVNMDTHGEQHVCWQCHYPHMPEVN
jgi:hypothetical protein